MKPNIALTEDQRAAVAGILNVLLADEYLLYTKTRNYHWNVTGPQFRELHAFFEEQYEELDEIVDAVAERARALGADASGALAEFLKNTRLKEDTGRPDARQMLAKLLADHETIIRHLRADLESCAQPHGDAGTSDFLTGLMEQHEKIAWMLRASLEQRDVRTSKRKDMEVGAIPILF